MGSAPAFWAIGQHLGDGVLSRNKRGYVLGQITDLKKSRKNCIQRGPYSSGEHPFYVDCCDLMCTQTVKYGGESSFVSSVTVHNEIFYRWPKLVEILFEPFFRDRRGEIPRGLKARCRLAAFHVHEGYFSASVDPTYMEPVRRSRKVPAFTGLQNDAIAKIQALSKELRFDTGFKRTDMHFCNNHVIFPARQAYKDHSSKKKWHLLHIWLKARDGRPLPADFYERHGEMNKIDCAGDIVAENTMLKVPI